MAAEESDVAVLNLENELPASADRDSPLLQEPEPADDGLDTPKKDHLLQWMELSITETEKRSIISSIKMQDIYTVYLIESKVIDPEMPGYGEPATCLWRRYSEFELLRNYLEVMYPAIIIPPLPEKRVSHAWQNLPTDRFDVDFVERRRVGLENFLLRTASHKILSQDKVFHSFLKQDDGWRETVYSTDFQSKADWKLKAMSASFRIRKTDPRFEALKNYSNDLQIHLNSILKIYARMTDHMYAIHKVHGNYGRVFSEWSAMERGMADGLQTAGHFMDVFAASVDPMLEDEQQFADQLKEYYNFCDALRSVTRKYELLELEAEKAEDNLIAKQQQREQLVQGKVPAFSLSGMKTKLFGSDTAEQKEVKVRQLCDEIVEAEAEVKRTREEIEKFSEMALRDADRFNRQKVKDVKDILTNYCIMQIDRCKKGLGVWQNIEDAFSKM